MNINGLDKAVVMAALVNAAKPLGLGALHPQAGVPVTVDECRDALKETTYFDYVRGRSCKIDLTTDELDLRLFDRDNGGPGAGERAIDDAIGELPF